MRILMISPYIPWPLYGGASVRMFNIIKELSKKGHKIVLLAGKQTNLDLSSSPLKQLCEEINLYELPKQGRLLSALRSIFSLQPYPALQFESKELYRKFSVLMKEEKFDLVWINFLFMSDVLFKIKGVDTPAILDQFESDESVWSGYIKDGNLPQKIFSYFNLRKIQILQKKVFKRINTLLCVSETEAEFVRSKMPAGKQIWVVPNGIDVDFFQHNEPVNESGQVILLTGSMCIVRNINAAVWFAKGIFAKIKKNIPEAEFWIVGYNPGKEILELKKTPGIKVFGTVQDIRPYYKKAKAYVAPFKFGQGTRLKVLEAMATGLPIVSTKEGCQGIGTVNNQHVLIADNENDFADRVIELLRNKQLSGKISNNAKTFVEQKYSWDKIVNDLEIKLKNDK